MFSTEKSDFAVPIVGYLLVAMVLIFEGISAFYYGNILKDDADFHFLTFFSLFLTIVGFVSLYKAYILDGMTFLIIGGAMFAICYLFTFQNMHIHPSVDIVIGVGLILVAAMAFRMRDIFVILTDLFAGLMFIIFGVFFFNMELTSVAIIAGICSFIGAVVALYNCITTWALVQDIAKEYEEEMYSDDCCCCGDENCDDSECKCGDECHCHDKKE